MNGARRDVLVGAVLVALFALVPWLTSSRYIVSQLTLCFIWGVVVVQWNLVLGVGGIFSLAQMALFGCGAYATAMIGYYGHWPLWAVLPLAGAVTVLLSMLIGWACLRLRGPYVALLTLAIAQVILVLIVNDTDCFTQDSGCMPLFGGVRGIGQFGDLGFREWFGPKWNVADYYLGLLLLALAFVFSAVIIRGPLGLAFKALRDNPGYATARGVSRFKYQLWLFALSAFFTGLAGAFYAAHFKVVGPTVFSFQTLLFLLAMIVVGGMGSTWGPLLGLALLMLADEGMKELSDLRNIGIGSLLAAFVVIWPQGIAGWLQRLGARPRRSTAESAVSTRAESRP